MSISVAFIIKNGIKQGYCFWESLQSCLPFADEIIISEGHSEDDTFKTLLSFESKYKSLLPINIFQDKWEDNSYVGEVIARVSERAIKKATCDWIYLLQADEIIHEDLAFCIKKISGSSQYNSVNFPFFHFIRSWEPYKNPAYKNAIRMIRRNKNCHLKGDAWTFSQINPVYPANLLPKPIFHFGWVFPKQNDIKDIEHAKFYQNITEYQDKMKMACRRFKQPKTPYPRTDFDDFPKLARRFIGAAEYTLPDIT